MLKEDLMLKGPAGPAAANSSRHIAVAAVRRCHGCDVRLQNRRVQGTHLDPFVCAVVTLRARKLTVAMRLQECRTCEYFYILEISHSSDGQPPLYVAQAPEFSTAPKYQPIVATGSSEREALKRLKYNIKVRQLECCMSVLTLLLEYMVS